MGFSSLRPVISGEAVMSLAVSEPWAGSDVANIRTSAVKSACGKFYIVNGEKKWITGGCKADYFTVAVRTGKKGFNGVSLLLIESNRKGVSTRRMKTQGWWCSTSSPLSPSIPSTHTHTHTHTNTHTHTLSPSLLFDE